MRSIWGVHRGLTKEPTTMLLQAGFGEHIKEFDLVINGDVGVLDLHTLPHTFFFVVNGGPFAVAWVKPPVAP